MSYPVHWLDETFSSRSRTESLLRPDLEAGLITEHDYHLATTFLPGYQRHYPLMCGTTGTFGTMSYGRFFARPAWGIQRTMVLGSVAYFVGALIGQLQRASAHFRFTQSLENPRGFAQALQNVNIRLGADKPLPWTLPQVGEILPSTIGSPDVHGDTARPDEGQSNTWAPEATYTMPASPGTTESPPPSSPSTPAGPSAKTASRWDEIRAANASARPSSWDAIRQRHERAAAADKVARSAGLATNAEDQTERDRAQEQARFDAVLEAERKIAGG